MITTDDFQNYYTREVGTRPGRKFAVFLILFVFNLIFFGFFGVVKGVISISQKNQLIDQYEGVTDDLEGNLDRALILEPYLSDNEAVDFLNTAITGKPETEDYLVDFLNAIFETGLTVESFTVDRSFGDGNDIPIRIALLGDVDRLPDLINIMEGMERLTVVENISIKSRNKKEIIEDIAKIDLTIKIYKVTES